MSRFNNKLKVVLLLIHIDQFNYHLNTRTLKTRKTDIYWIWRIIVVAPFSQGQAFDFWIGHFSRRCETHQARFKWFRYNWKLLLCFVLWKSTIIWKSRMRITVTHFLNSPQTFYRISPLLFCHQSRYCSSLLHQHQMWMTQQRLILLLEHTH